MSIFFPLSVLILQFNPQKLQFNVKLYDKIKTCVNLILSSFLIFARTDGEKEIEGFMLTAIDYFILGSYSILCIIYLVEFVVNRKETYILYFSIGCLISIVRVVVVHWIPIHEDNYNTLFRFVYFLHYMSFMWGPVFCMKLSLNLCNSKEKWPNRIFTGLVVMISIFVLATPPKIYANIPIYGIVIIVVLSYSCYIHTKAAFQKQPYSLPLCIGNYIMCLGIVYDVLLGESLIPFDTGELHYYAYFVYLIIFSVVITSKYKDIQTHAARTEIKYLNAQIQPHFLFNTLNTIIAYIRVEPDTARDLLLEFSTWLRGKFRYYSEGTEISLNEEMEIIKAYLKIEQARYKDRLRIIYDVDEHIGTKIPCLLLQPLVENAIKHGVAPLKDGGTVSISVKHANGILFISISDTGNGMDEKKIDKILSGEQSSSGVGLCNINLRLRALYNTQLQIISVPGEGTSVSMKIPDKGCRNDQNGNRR